MDLGLRGRHAVVCASSKGLGRAAALELAGEGANVLICGRNAASLDEAREEIARLGGGSVIAVKADLTTPEGRAAVLAAAAAEFPRVDILVTNTGGPPAGRVEEHDAAAWESAYRLLVESAVAMIRGCLPSMKENRWGRIIAITSQAAKQPVDGLILSNAMRASVVGLCRTLANEVGSHNITVNNVMPGYTRTDRLQQLALSQERHAGLIEEIPLRRLGEPREFGGVVAFLASERAAYVSGISLPVDGGWCRGLL